MNDRADSEAATAGGGIRRRGLRDMVYDSIFRQLLSGAVPPGTRLRAESIAKELEVSPTPVREALVQLERTGLVTREARKGYRVAPPLQASQMEQLFDARIMLETTAARLAASASDRLLVELEAAEDVHRRAGEALIAGRAAGSLDIELAAEYLAADTAFHEVIFRGCGNDYLLEMSENLAAQIHRMRQIVLREVSDVKESIIEHEAIVQAFASGDPDAPEAAMRAHVEQVRQRERSPSFARTPE
ncbi:GntR family transcriptional regulator [Brachybacterium hainanense]|uniref:GntR family transcriptional regulator n=1 Tax=Brachybacterium hainanense TaxID=1541174 RepID=A0ABV6RBM0_9MICO